MKIENKGHHKDLRAGEVFIGYLSELQFQRFNTWQFSRLGKGRVIKGKNIDVGKRPFFLNISEVKERGLEIV